MKPFAIPEEERWVHEPALVGRLEIATNWMQHFVCTYANRNLGNRMVLHKNFQCEIHVLEDEAVNEIAKTLRAVSSMDWADTIGSEVLAFRDLQSRPGYYSMRLTNSHQAVVGVDREQLLFLTLHCEETSTPRPYVWPIGSTVSSFSLQHNHPVAGIITAKELDNWLVNCPRCRAAASEREQLFRLAMPLYVDMLCSSPFYEERRYDESFWSSYIGSRLVAAQRLVAKECGVFIPLSGHETPDKKLRQCLCDWQAAHPNETPDHRVS